MVRASPRTAPFVLLVSTISVTWGLWGGQAYWSLLSLLAVAWAAWTLWQSIEISTPTWLLAVSSLAAVPAIGLVGDQATWPLLEYVLAPVLLYALALGTIAPTIGTTKACGPGPLILMTYLAAIAAGCMVLLALYYLDALLSTTYLNSNSDLMWPLSILFLGTLVISVAVRASGLESAIWGQQEVSG